MVRFDNNKGTYVRMKLIEKMIDHMDIPSSIILRVRTELKALPNAYVKGIVSRD
jgi:hypothetical protein